MYKFEFITDWETIWSDDFQNQWLNWLENSEEPNIFFHPKFVKVWTETYLPIRYIKPIFCIAKDENENIVFLPLVIWNKDWKSAFEKVIVPVGYSDYDYNYPICKGNFSVSFWEELINILNSSFNKQFNKIELTGIPNCFINKDFFNLFEDDICPLIEIENYESYDDFMSNIKSKERSDIKRQERRLRELGEFEFKIYTPNEKDLALKTLDELLYHHKLRWPNAYKAQNYHKNLIKNLLSNGLLHMSEIKIDGKAICWNISFVYKGKYYFYMPTYVEEFKKFSPGKVNLFLCLKDCFEKDFKVFDMLKGAEDYKKKIPAKDIEVYKIIKSNDKLSTKIKKAALDVKSKIK